MASYLFFLGRTPGLAAEELRIFLPNQSELAPGIIMCDCPDMIRIDGKDTPIDGLLSKIAGTVKIARVCGDVEHVTPQSLVPFFPSGEKRVTFTLSAYGIQPLKEQFFSELKNDVARMYSHVRFIKPNANEPVSPVLFEKEHITELNIIFHDGVFTVAKTIAVHRYEEWSGRDFGRPFSDAKAGMLPPKVARMIVNLALKQDGRGKNLLDPFCGMGTILGEALVRNAAIIGSDVDEESVKKAEANIKWLEKTYGTVAKRQFFISDATHVSEHLGSSSVDSIVTEPFMGTTRLGEGKITDLSKASNIMKGLSKLYLGCFREWRSILKPDGMVIIAIPSIHIQGKTISCVKTIIDSCEILGYTKVLENLPYSRPQAIVKRNFFVFVKKMSTR